MADENKNSETPDLGQRDLNNPRDRDALKRAADDFLKARKDEAVAEAAEDDAAAEDAINPLAELQVENNALKDQMLRLAADMENLRKRTAR
ncbi:MAG: nucleotide exchange factor GrpE, partial [Brucellaceae bacterium]|nr:nucleotide exchange factor GrpE [Brucellaceae bacterium]